MKILGIDAQEHAIESKTATGCTKEEAINNLFKKIREAGNTASTNMCKNGECDLGNC